ncbi:hypothetical protein ACFL35_13000 [Candidatus Riflebacteria bacterium]
MQSNNLEKLKLILFLLFFSVNFLYAADKIPSSGSWKLKYFFGETRIFLADGTMLGTGQILAARKLFPDFNIILEQVVFIDPSRGSQPEEFVVLMNVINGNRLHMLELKDSFHGNGRLFGKPWNWYGMKTESILADGKKVVSVNFSGPRGIKAEKRVYSSDGKLTLVMKEFLPHISKIDFEKRYKGYFPGKKGR